MNSFMIAAASLVLAFSAAAQESAPPRDSAVTFPVSDLHEQIAKLIPTAQAKGGGGSTIEDYRSYKLQLSVRTVSGGAEVHAHWDDVMVVEQGTATLITGGTVVDGKTGDDGETHGSKIDGGHSQTLAPGDIVTVHAGTPHQLMLTPGTVYGAMVVKIHEP